jgi:hypothetical protein
MSRIIDICVGSAVFDGVGVVLACGLGANVSIITISVGRCCAVYWREGGICVGRDYSIPEY